ncbi:MULTISPECIES: protease modulator HflC [Paracoccus]|uniref:Protease modulator HflC n=1 Tax=Paracoccus haeundaensis TaxID=225362 RepID=A0A5C4R837_9RHOB|nr:MULTISPECIES: protease modulator HflC [Paracoccus]MBF5078628.1 protease modulator HflC [Paracoccus sp. NBH48]TNH39841.1 protease modulator HflC [Paracoccus haeundaensis]
MAARKNLLTALALPAVVVVAVLAGSALFIVDEREKALVLRLGRVVDVQETPGLNFKLPFIDNVVKYDGRILGLPTSPLEVTPLDDRRLVVDAFARWRITDPVRFRQAVGVQGIQAAEMRLEPIVIDAIRGVLGTVPSTSVLSDDRTSLMNQIRDEARSNSGGLGIEIIDVRLTRTDLPEQNLNATYARMRAERAREAADEVARGNEAAQRVRAAADRTVVELTSEAGRRSEIVRGEADAQRNAIYADAYGRDPEFFAFTRSLTSYQRALQGSNSSLVMQPDSEFFSYLSSDGAANANPASTPVPPGNSAERLGLNGPAETPEGEELVVPEVVDRDGNRLGESAGIELTPVPENLATPPQEPSEILSPDAPVEGAAQSEDAPAEEAPAPEAPAEDTAAEPTPAN